MVTAQPAEARFAVAASTHAHARAAAAVPGLIAIIMVAVRGASRGPGVVPFLQATKNCVVSLLRGFLRCASSNLTCILIYSNLEDVTI